MVNKVIKVVLIVLIIYIVLIIIATMTWNYRPTMYNNTKYVTTTDLNINNIDENSLFVSQHLTDMIVTEQMIMCEECLKSSTKFNIVSEISKDWFFEFFKNLPKMTSYELVKIDKSQKNNKTSKLISKLQDNENVLIFLKPKIKSTGIYYILKETKKPLILVNIRDTDKTTKIFNKNMELSYRKIDYSIDQEADKFMDWLKNELYTETVF